MKFAIKAISDNTHLILGMLLHYLGKLNIQIFCRYEIKCKQITFLIIFSERTYVTFAICYRPSVCLLSVTLVHPTQAVELFGNFFSPYDSPGTLLFWCQKSLVGDAPFPLNLRSK